MQYPSGQQGPQQGTPTTYALFRGRPNGAVELMIGVDKNQMNGIPLPLDLGVIQMPGCTLYHDILARVPAVTSVFGTTSVPITWPVDPATVGTHLYSTYLVLDSNANPLGGVLSNAVDVELGGNL